MMTRKDDDSKDNAAARYTRFHAYVALGAAGVAVVAAGVAVAVACGWTPSLWSLSREDAIIEAATAEGRERPSHPNVLRAFGEAVDGEHGGEGGGEGGVAVRRGPLQLGIGRLVR